MIEFRITTNGVLERYHNQLAALGQDRMRQVLQRALAHTGNKAKTQVIRALTRQTGLKRQVIMRAVRFRKPSHRDLSYVLKSQGGNIALRFFRPRETRAGVSAQPLGKRRVFASTFLRAGWWPRRVEHRPWHGRVLRRTGEVTKDGKDKFAEVKSDVFIPDEMLSGNTFAAWRQVAERDLADRVGHEIGRLLGTLGD